MKLLRNHFVTSCRNWKIHHVVGKVIGIVPNLQCMFLTVTITARFGIVDATIPKRWPFSLNVIPLSKPSGERIFFGFSALYILLVTLRKVNFDFVSLVSEVFEEFYATTSHQFQNFTAVLEKPKEGQSPTILTLKLSSLSYPQGRTERQVSRWEIFENLLSCTWYTWTPLLHFILKAFKLSHAGASALQTALFITLQHTPNHNAIWSFLGRMKLLCAFLRKKIQYFLASHSCEYIFDLGPACLNIKCV